MPTQNKNQKLIASTLVIVAVIVLALVASAGAKQDESTSQSETTSQVAGATDITSSTSNTTSTTGTTATTSTASSSYKDGTYTSSDSYSSPGGTEGIEVTVTVSSGVVTAATISQDATNHESEEYQDAFASSFKSKVVGQAIDSLSLSRVSGASLTTDGFNDALDQIRSQAQA